MINDRLTQRKIEIRSRGLIRFEAGNEAVLRSEEYGGGAQKLVIGMQDLSIATFRVGLTFH